jgi:hypothetical protein
MQYSLFRGKRQNKKKRLSLSLQTLPNGTQAELLQTEDTLPLCSTAVQSIIVTMSSFFMNKNLGTLIVSQTSRNTAVRAMSSDTGSLTRTGLAKLVSEQHELTMAKSERIVKTVFDSIVEVRDMWAIERWDMLYCTIISILPRTFVH